MCTNLARSRGAIGVTEIGDDRKIADMVSAYWSGRQADQVAAVIPDMISHFGGVFTAADNQGLRDFLKLPEQVAEPPGNVGAENDSVPEQPGDVSDEAIAATARHWNSARVQIQAELDKLRRAVDAFVDEESEAGLEFVGGTWGPVTAIFDALVDGSLDGAIRAIPGKVGAERIRAIAEVRGDIERKLAQWRADPRLSQLDASPLLDETGVFRKTLEESLLAMRALMVPGAGGSPG
jgi:hypothetical protein